MKIEINLQAPELVDAINNLANTWGAAPQSTTTSKSEKIKEKEDSKEPDTFKKASYFYHSGSDSYLAFKKGDEVPTDPDFLDSDSITKKEYDKGVAEQKKAEEPEEKKEDSSDEKSDEAPTVEEVRAKTAEVAKAGKKEEIKDLLAELGVSAVSKIPEDQRAEYLEKLAEL
ncbi:hypothetical protein MST22_15620 [Virgibacillus halodenitrificans]|uniref:hypothetical protein n=1 Tax=Virgibacillus halodenitrificans TaxID=1482 RepID=UPI001FB54E7A|nr:hypothetical protein [Virgibacillus halodenitrificans]MCJ0932576.1 hypothetical protein [Virgibacillus halodenitrificans]